MSNKRNRDVLDEVEYIVDEYEYPSDNGLDEEPTKLDNSSFHLRGNNFSSHVQGNSSSSSMAPGSSSSSAVLSSNAEFYANDRSFFIDGALEHQYRDRFGLARGGFSDFSSPPFSCSSRFPARMALYNPCRS